MTSLNPELGCMASSAMRNESLGDKMRKKIACRWKIRLREGSVGQGHCLVAPRPGAS